LVFGFDCDRNFDCDACKRKKRNKKKRKKRERERQNKGEDTSPNSSGYIVRGIFNGMSIPA